MPPKFQRWSGIMKAYPFEEKRLAKWEPPYIVQPKYDGDRGRDVPLDSGEHLILSSEENPFFCLPHINEALKKLNIPHMKFDGELYNHNIYLEGGQNLIHSIVSRSVNIHPRYEEMEFHIFDYQDETVSQIERTNTLGNIDFKPPLIRAPYWLCYTLDQVKRVYDKIISMKYEGIVVRNLYGAYEIDKRSRWLMKFKPKRKDIYNIIGWKEEVSINGIPKGRIGSLIMSSQPGDTFGVSAGLNDDEKARLWNVRDRLDTMKAIVHYQHLTNKKIPKGTFDVEVIENE